MGKMIKNILSLFLVIPLISACTSPEVSEKETITIYVQGEVSNPGEHEIEKGSGIVHALIAAGAPTLYANKKVSVKYRVDTDENIRMRKFDLQEIIDGITKDLILEDQDTVMMWHNSWGGYYFGDELPAFTNQMVNYIKNYRTKHSTLR